jgi:hypothetical protein
MTSDRNVEIVACGECDGCLQIACHWGRGGEVHREPAGEGELVCSCGACDDDSFTLETACHRFCEERMAGDEHFVEQLVQKVGSDYQEIGETMSPEMFTAKLGAAADELHAKLNKGN